MHGTALLVTKHKHQENKSYGQKHTTEQNKTKNPVAATSFSNGLFSHQAAKVSATDGNLTT
jgi:hypothetical protein